MRARVKARAFFGGAGRQKFPEAFGCQSFLHLSVSVRHRRPSEHASCRGTKGAYFFADRVAPCVRPCMRGNDKVRVRAWRGGNAFMRIAGMGRQLVIL